MPRPQQRTLELHIGGRCALDCAPCDCRVPALSDEEIARRLADGGARVTLRGALDQGAALDQLLQRVQGTFRDVVLRTNAIAFQTAADAAHLVDRGVHTALIPLFSHSSAAHDRITRKEGSLVAALVGMRSLAAAGLGIEVEIPLLPAKLQDLPALVDLAHRAVPELRAVRPFVPKHVQPDVLAPPRWSDSASNVVAMIDRCRAEHIVCKLELTSAVPLCALREFPDACDAFRFDPRGRAQVAGCDKPAVCDRCATRDQCAGVAKSYAAAHGTADIVAFARKPRRMYSQRTTPARAWSDREREAAKNTRMVVLRPTVHCNQDCAFCSANETTMNVWPEPRTMMRAIARAARRGVERVSFSGGEPTLSRHLVNYVRVARQCGVPRIELVTNGVLLDRPAKVSQLREAGLTDAYVSMHAHDERLSRLMTAKIGDFDRTARAVDLLVEAGIRTVLNHVVNTHNYRYVQRFVEFVHERYGCQVLISFAFITPQFKALEHLDLVPKLSELMPHLRRAMYRALDLGQSFVIGSRQGVPPCLLGEFAGWSDILELSNEAAAEDTPQKRRAPECDECKYSECCTGLWNPYAARYGLDELRPVPGDILDEAGRRELLRRSRGTIWGVPPSFEAVPEVLRVRDCELAGVAALTDTVEADEPPPTLPLARTRPLRTAVAGTGPRASQLVAAAAELADLSIDAAASPHAPDAELPDAFARCPAYRDIGALIDDIRPEAVIVASSTDSHVEAVDHGIRAETPVLVEKPLAPTRAEAVAVAERARTAGVAISMAHNDLHADGLSNVLALRGCGRFSISRRFTAASPGAPTLWSYERLYQTLYHAISIAISYAGCEPAQITNLRWDSPARPARIRAELAFETCTGAIEWETGAAADELAVSASTNDARRSWRRRGRDITLDSGDGPEAVERVSSEATAMLAHFRDTVLGRVAPIATAADGIAAMDLTTAILDALEQAGAPFRRAGAPHHASSPELRRR